MAGKLKKTVSPLNSPKKKRTPFLIVMVVALLFIGLQYSTSLFSPDLEKDAWGKIILPVEGSVTGKSVHVVGATQDIQTGLYVWLSIDSPGTGQCRPQKQVLRNTRFSTRLVLTESLHPADTLALHVLDKRMHDEWKNRQDQKRSTALPLPRGIWQLDQIRLYSGQGTSGIKP